MDSLCLFYYSLAVFHNDAALAIYNDGNIIFSTQSSIFSYSLDNGYTNWEKDVSSIATPIVDGKNIFFVTEKCIA